MGHVDKEWGPHHHPLGPKHQTRKTPVDCDRKGGSGTVLGAAQGEPKRIEETQPCEQSRLSMVGAESTELEVEQKCQGIGEVARGMD
jgi:hypothetical protein